MKRRKHLYPGTEEAEQERSRAARRPSLDDEPDFLPSGAPNYEKFEKYGWDTEKILVWLNID